MAGNSGEGIRVERRPASKRRQVVALGPEVVFNSAGRDDGVAALAGTAGLPVAAAAAPPIRHVVIIYLENHSFDNVLGYALGRGGCDAHRGSRQDPERHSQRPVAGDGDGQRENGRLGEHTAERGHDRLWPPRKGNTPTGCETFAPRSPNASTPAKTGTWLPPGSSQRMPRMATFPPSPLSPLAATPSRNPVTTR
jgi:hypothetical protein